MFNAKYKKEAVADLEQEANKYQKVYDKAMEDVVNLHEKRLSAVDVIKQVEGFINTLANTPKEFQKTIGNIKINRKGFETKVHNIELESKKSNAASRNMVRVIAMATTFSVAPIGSPIGALAWLGGALVANDGATAGQAYLAMSGPVGWVIGGGLLVNSKNKKIAEQAEEQTIAIKKENNKLSKVRTKVRALSKEIVNMSGNLTSLFNTIVGYKIKDYRDFKDEQLEQLKILLNVTTSLSTKISEKVK